MWRDQRDINVEQVTERKGPPGDHLVLLLAYLQGGGRVENWVDVKDDGEAEEIRREGQKNIAW